MDEPTPEAIIANYLQGLNKYVAFADDLYEWTGSCYRRLTDRQMIRSVLYDECTLAVFYSAIKRLKMLVGIDGSDETHSPPFWIEDDDLVPGEAVTDEIKRQTPIAFGNGVLLLERYLDGDPDCFLQPTPALFATAVAEYDYDPNATCEQWLEFLHWFTCGRSGYQDVLQQFLGSIFLTSNYQKFLWLQGAGKNGKSVLVKTITSVIGAGQVANVDVSQLGGRFGKQSLIGKRLNVSQEFSQLTDKIEDSIKKLTSSEAVAIDRKFRSVLDVHLGCRLMLVSNSVPHIHDKSDGFFRRMLLVRCEAKPQQERIDFEKTLLKEAPGILNWMLEGARLVLAAGEIAVPQLIRDDIDGLKVENDPVARFVGEFFVCTGRQTDVIVTDIKQEVSSTPRYGGTSVVVAYQEYTKWCENNGHKNPASSATFVRRVKEITGCTKDRATVDGKVRSVFVGLMWVDEARAAFFWGGSLSADDLPDSPHKREWLEEKTRRDEERRNRPVVTEIAKPSAPVIPPAPELEALLKAERLKEDQEFDVLLAEIEEEEMTNHESQ